MLGKDTYCVEIAPNLIKDYQKCLISLYLPLIGNEACCLYFYLLEDEQYHIKEDLNHLCLIQNYGIDSLQKNLSSLEKHSLIKTYQKGDEYLFELISPKCGKDFFADQVLSRLLIKRLGEQEYMLLKAKLSTNKISNDEFKDITQKFNIQELNEWDQQQENIYQRSNSQTFVDQAIDFDYDLFFRNITELIFPSSLRTKENLLIIGKYGSQFSLPAMEMSKLVGKSTTRDKGQYIFDPDKLHKLCLSSKAINLESNVFDYKANPVNFLYAKQKVPVSSADKSLIEYLQSDLHFDNEVTNLLIEETLKNTGNKLSRSYVEKVATSWVRGGVDSYQKALDMINSKPYAKEKLVYTGDEMTVKPQDINELRRKMFGDETDEKA